MLKDKSPSVSSMGRDFQQTGILPKVQRVYGSKPTKYIQIPHVEGMSIRKSQIY